MCDRRTDMYLSRLNNIKHVTDRHEKKMLMFLVKIFVRERRIERLTK